MKQYSFSNGYNDRDQVSVLSDTIDNAEASLSFVTAQTKQQRLFSITKAHPYGKAYFHIPTGTMVWISVVYEGLKYSVHRMGISGGFTCKHNDLRPWQYGDCDYRVSEGPGKNPVPFSNLSEALTYAVRVNGELLCFSERDNMYRPVNDI